MQGGIEYLRNINLKPSINLEKNLKPSINLEIEISSNHKIETFPVRIKRKEMILGSTYEITYGFALEFYKRKAGFRISKDELNLKFKLKKVQRQKNKYIEKEIIGEGALSLINHNGKINPVFNLPEEIKREDIFPIDFKKTKLPPKLLLIETPILLMPFDINSIFSDISVYNFDPKQPKRGIPFSGRTELEEDGENLAIVLKNIFEDKNKKRKFSNLIKDILSFVEDLGVTIFADRSLLIKLKEKYSGNKFLPAPLISDGTINITTLLVALYFEEKPLIIIEEPERNIHPYLISRIIDMMKEVSNKRQIITTTHNPEMLKQVNLEDILFISRDKNGFSKIIRPYKQKEVEIFLKNELGIDEIFTKNLLRISNDV